MFQNRSTGMDFRVLNGFKMTRMVGSVDFRFSLVVLLLLRKNSSRYFPLMILYVL